ncbi:methylamine utilization protein [Alteromonas sp. CYL-A6]|uniref:methylamine utilization protein n=1 Tax=Alteromonas nitratireducens TaxID=3390813 RepID=UPI0034C061AE
MPHFFGKARAWGFLLFLPVLCLAASVSAKTLVLVDQNASPLKDVVVSIPVTTPVPVPDEPAIMDQVDKQFAPYVLAIPRGQYVSFPNSDNIRHHVYSFSAPKMFEIKLYSGDSVKPVVFDKPGLVVLGCNIHDQMIGYIYVYDNEQVVISPGSGEVTLPDNVTEVTLWHPDLSLDQTLRQTFTLDPDEQTETLTLTLMSPPDQDTEKDAPATFGKRKFGGD